MTLTSPASGPEVTNEWSFTYFIAAFKRFRVQICISHPKVLGDFIILSKQTSGQLLELGHDLFLSHPL
jgi:hypothetical protein